MEEEAIETAKHAGTTSAVLGGMALAPQTGGVLLAVAGGYAGGRVLLEETETGKAVDKAVSNGILIFSILIFLSWPGLSYSQNQGIPDCCKTDDRYI